MTTDDLNEDQANQEDSSPSHLRRMLETEKREKAEVAARLADLERKEAFRDAGLDPTNKLHSALIKAYDGELNGEDVRSYVDSLGITQQTETVSEPETPAEERQSIDRIASASAGDTAPPPQPDRIEQLRKEADVAARKGDNATVDRLLVEMSRAKGLPTAWDGTGR